MAFGSIFGFSVRHRLGNGVPAIPNISTSTEENAILSVNICFYCLLIHSVHTWYTRTSHVLVHCMRYNLYGVVVWVRVWVYNCICRCHRSVEFETASIRSATGQSIIKQSKRNLVTIRSDVSIASHVCLCVAKDKKFIGLWMPSLRRLSACRMSCSTIVT